MTTTAWPPTAGPGDELTDLAAGLSRAFGADPATWDPEVRVLYELALRLRITDLETQLAAARRRNQILRGTK